jgi:hypothetical protein
VSRRASKSHPADTSSSRRAHLRYGTGRHLALVLQPGVEHAQAPVAIGGGGWLPAGKLVGDERLDVLAPGLLKLDAPGGEELGRQPNRVEVGLDSAVGLVLGPAVQLEGARQVGYAGVDYGRTIPANGVVSQVLLNRRARDPSRCFGARTAAQDTYFSGM